MKTLRLLTAAALGAVLALAAGEARAQEILSRAPSVDARNVSINPTRLSAAGGAVNVRARIVKGKGVVIQSVLALARLPGRPPNEGPMQARGGGVYSGVVTVPQNSSRSAVFADILVRVVTNRGTRTKKVGRVRLNAFDGDPTSPPAPPPI